MRASEPARAVRVLTAFVLLAAVLAAFAGVRANGWVLIDDPIYVTENPHVTGGLTWDAVKWFLHAPHGGNWHPLTSLTHLLDVSLFGLVPAGPHTINLLLHALNALLLLFVLHRMTGAWWRSLAVAALFALHPLRVESVAWIAERKDVLSGAFFLLTLLAWQRWTERPSAGRYAAVCVALALGLASKPMLVTVPALLLLLDIWPLQRLPLNSNALHDGTLAARLREKLLPLLIALAFVVVTYLVQRGTGAMTDGGTLPLATRAGNAALSVWRYVGRSVWPVDLAVFYPYALPLAAPAVAIAALGIAAVTALALRERNGRPWLLVGWLWLLGMLLPVLGLVQVGRQSWADRYSYLPTIGLAIIVAWGASALAAKGRFARGAVVALLVTVCAALGVASSRQVAHWKDSETLFAWTARVVPNNATALMGLGNAYMKQRGRAADAVAPFAEALRLEPGNAEARDRLVVVLMRLQRDEEALQVTLDGLRLRPSAQGWFNVGVLEAKRGRDSVAVEAFARSAKLDPTHAPTRLQWFEALTRLDRPREALVQLDEALRLTPGDTGLLLQSAWIRATAGETSLRDGALAVRHAEQARAAAHESDAVLEATLAAAYAEARRWPEAIAAAERAVKLARAHESKSEVGLFELQLALYRGHQPMRAR